MSAALLMYGVVASGETVPLKPKGGTFVVPVLINDKITLDFTIDSGAADVSIPADVFSTLVRAGTVAESDLLDTQIYSLADGSKQSSKRFSIRSLRVGSYELQGVIGSVSPAAGPLLLGQSFLSRIKSWSIDNERHLLIFNEPPNPQAGGTASPLSAIARRPRAARRVAPATAAERAGDGALLKAIAFVLTGDDANAITFVDRAECAVRFHPGTGNYFDDTYELAQTPAITVYLNRVNLARSGVRAFEHGVEVTLRGESVVRYPPAKSTSEYRITHGTDEYQRFRRALDYIYSHGCKGAKDAF